MPVLHFSRSPALPRAMMVGLILLAGCSGSANDTAPKASSTPATDARPTETHGPELVAAMLRLSFVGCVDRSGPERPVRHTLVHLRDVRYRTIWEFEAGQDQTSEQRLSDDELNRVYESYSRRLRVIQAEQAELICWFARHAGIQHAWFEDVTDSSQSLFEKLAKDVAAQKSDPGLRLRLGAPGRLLAAEMMRVWPLPEDVSRESASDGAERRQPYEDALLRRILDAREPLSVVVLEGEHDLRDNLARLAPEDWELLTVDVQAYVRFGQTAGD